MSSAELSPPDESPSRARDVSPTKNSPLKPFPQRPFRPSSAKGVPGTDVLLIRDLLIRDLYRDAAPSTPPAGLRRARDSVEDAVSVVVPRDQTPPAYRRVTHSALRRPAGPSNAVLAKLPGRPRDAHFVGGATQAVEISESVLPNLLEEQSSLLDEVAAAAPPGEVVHPPLDAVASWSSLPESHASASIPGAPVGLEEPPAHAPFLPYVRVAVRGHSASPQRARSAVDALGAHGLSPERSFSRAGRFEVNRAHTHSVVHAAARLGQVEGSGTDRVSVAEQSRASSRLAAHKMTWVREAKEMRPAGPEPLRPPEPPRRGRLGASALRGAVAAKTSTYHNSVAFRDRSQMSLAEQRWMGMLAESAFEPRISKEQQPGAKGLPAVTPRSRRSPRASVPEGATAPAHAGDWRTSRKSAGGAVVAKPAPVQPPESLRRLGGYVLMDQSDEVPVEQKAVDWKALGLRSEHRVELRPPAELQTLPKLTGKELVEKLRQIMSMPRTTEHEREPSSKGAVAGPPPAPARGVPSAQDVVTHWLLAAKKVPRPPAKLLPWASKRASARVIEASSEGDFYWEEPSWKGSSDLTPEQRQMQLEKGAVTFGRGVGRFTWGGRLKGVWHKDLD